MKDFKEQAELTLDNIFNLVESKFEGFEVDYEEENLRIDSLSNGKVFILSIHSPTSQIWLSSPISGAHHFERSSSNPLVWVSTRDHKIKLLELLKQELSGNLC